MLRYSWDPSQLHRSWPGGRHNQPSNLQEMSELLNIKPKCDSGISMIPLWGKKILVECNKGLTLVNL